MSTMLLMQDKGYQRTPIVISSAKSVNCHVCGKGLEDGYAITAKQISGRTAMFCNFHY